MKSKAKKILTATICSVVILTSGVVSLYIWGLPATVSSKWFNDTVTKEANKFLGAEVVINNPQLKTGFNSDIGFSVDKFTISKNKKELLNLSKLDTEFSFSDIFQKRLIVKKVLADNIYVNSSELIALGTLEGGVDDYPTLQSNISWTMQAVDDTFQFSISNTDSSSGIQLRNEMLDKMNVTLGTAILDYDGTTILTDTSMAANNTSLYMRNDSVDGSQTTYRIASATKFIPKKISYSKITGTSDYDIVPSIQTSNLNSKEINLTRYFIIDQDGLLVLKDPKSSEFSFKRDGEKDTGTIDGYQNVCIMETYRGWG